MQHDFGKILSEQSTLHGQAAREHWKAGRASLKAYMVDLLALYDRAQLDPEFKMPTYLHLAFENLRREIMDGTPRSTSDQDAERAATEAGERE